MVMFQLDMSGCIYIYICIYISIYIHFGGLCHLFRSQSDKYPKFVIPCLVCLVVRLGGTQIIVISGTGQTFLHLRCETSKCSTSIFIENLKPPNKIPENLPSFSEKQINFSPNLTSPRNLYNLLRQSTGKPPRLVFDRFPPTPKSGGPKTGGFFGMPPRCHRCCVPDRHSWASPWVRLRFSPRNTGNLSNPPGWKP